MSNIVEATPVVVVAEVQQVQDASAVVTTPKSKLSISDKWNLHYRALRQYLKTHANKHVPLKAKIHFEGNYNPYYIFL